MENRMAYGNTTDAQAHWTAKGYAGTPTDATLAVASTFIDGLGWRMAGKVAVSRFPGIPTGVDQEDQWPRTDATDIYGRDLASDVVPGAVLRATYEAAFYEDNNPGGLNEAIRSDERIVREKFDTIEFQYAEPETGQSAGLAPATPLIPAILTILAPVMAGGSNPYGITGIVA